MYILTSLEKYLLENNSNNQQQSLSLYRGEDDEGYKPTDREYAFFSTSKSFAEGYGYVWKCDFEPMKIFISYTKESAEELYKEGFKLRDQYIEDMWDKIDPIIKDLYEYNPQSSDIDNWGYKSSEHLNKSPYFHSDTWEMIENNYGVLDYILSKYDGVSLLEGGEVTFYLPTDKIKICRRV